MTHLASSPSAATSGTALLGLGEVRHTRLRPATHRFAYRTFFLMLPMRQLARQPEALLRRNRRGALSFHDRDHGEGGDDALAWIESLLRSHGIEDAQGEIWLQTYPRVLGYVFKPVSFWYCHRADGALRAVVAEVNNTFGERHCYLLEGHATDAKGGLPWGQELRSVKVFLVSPFCDVQGQYRFRFMRTEQRIVARVDHDDATGCILQTSVSGRLVPISRASLRQALWGTPLMTLAVVARIHWQALQLWLKRVPFFRKPEPPQAFITR